jgi:4-hydroxybenzoyl-CoA thioesterase
MFRHAPRLLVRAAIVKTGAGVRKFRITESLLRRTARRALMLSLNSASRLVRSLFLPPLLARAVNVDQDAGQRFETVDPPRNLRLSCRSMASLRNKRQLTVEWGHCDPAGIVFNPRFFEYFDWGTWGLLEAALGVKAHELASTYGIMGIPLVDAGAKFLGPAKFGDVVELTSWVSEFRRSSFDVIHELRVHGALAVEGKETRVWAIRDASDPMKIKSQPIPPEVIARFDVQ